VAAQRQQKQQQYHSLVHIYAVVILQLLGWPLHTVALGHMLLQDHAHRKAGLLQIHLPAACVAGSPGDSYRRVISV
jgi:hypothetical protein